MHNHGVHQQRSSLPKNFLLSLFHPSPASSGHSSRIQSRSPVAHQKSWRQGCRILVSVFSSSRAAHEELVRDDTSPRDVSELHPHQQLLILSLLFCSDSQHTSEPGGADDIQQSTLKISVVISIQEPREHYSGHTLRYMRHQLWEYRDGNFLQILGNFTCIFFSIQFLLQFLSSPDKRDLSFWQIAWRNQESLFLITALDLALPKLL